MSECKMLADFAACKPAPPRFTEPLPFPELQSKIRYLFRFDKAGCFLFKYNFTQLTRIEQDDLFMIEEYVESNKWHFTNTMHHYDQLDPEIKSSYLFVSKNPFHITDRGDVYLTISTFRK